MLIAVLVAATLASVVMLRADSGIQATTPLEEEYWTLVDRSLRRDPQVIAQILTWKDSDIRKAVDGLSRLTVRGRAASPGEVTARFKAAAVLMHTDAGLAQIRQGKPDSMHLKVAYELMRDSVAAPLGASDTALGVFTLRNWGLAVAQSLIQQTAYDTARAVLAALVKQMAYDTPRTVVGASSPGASQRVMREATDADLVFTAAWLEETCAFFQAHESSARPASMAREIETTTPYMSGRQQAARDALRVREARQRAEELYRRVLELDVARDDARLRLGHVLLDDGQVAEAAIHLERVVSQNHEPRLRHLAALFLGRLREQQTRMDAAIDLYSKALAAEPRSQTARVALAAALGATGRWKSAGETIAPLAGRRTTDVNFTDPWSAYILGQGDSDPLSGLRAALVAR